jgi:hypothetical protein
MELAGRLGPRWRAAFGINPFGTDEVALPPLSEDEEYTMVECARRVSELASGRKRVGAVKPLAKPPPHPVLFDTGHTPKR